MFCFKVIQTISRSFDGKWLTWRSSKFYLLLECKILTSSFTKTKPTPANNVLRPLKKQAPSINQFLNSLVTLLNSNCVTWINDSFRSSTLLQIYHRRQQLMFPTHALPKVHCSSLFLPRTPRTPKSANCAQFSWALPQIKPPLAPGLAVKLSTDGIAERKLCVSWLP